MDQTSLTRIENDPNYLKLVSERKSLGWTLTVITLVMYYGYIAIVAFAPSRNRASARRIDNGRASSSALRHHPRVDPADRHLRLAGQLPNTTT